MGDRAGERVVDHDRRNGGGKADLSLALGEMAVTVETLPSALDAAAKGDHTQRIFLRADKTVPYGSLMDAMNALRAANYLKVALVGLEPETTP